MIVDREWVIFVVVHSDNIAVPCDTLTIEAIVESKLSLLRVGLECLIAASSQVGSPGDARAMEVMNMALLNQDENINGEACCDDHKCIQDRSSRQNDTECA